ncbi:unnamed protein product [Callosobruchus maculatus]|uniref:Peptidase S1 domain-containing protein n=1 Tax=Callosobruchus maculatus TaxID=64391 RepID=A0A653C2H3_CALMS|nr:unnamed protein product [Callosobruchus maculatus]
MSKSNVQLVYSAVFLVMLFHIKFCLSEEKIIGGQVCTSVKHDFVVAILAKEDLGKMHICTGSLLNAKWVLTAAHCCTRMTGFVMAGVSIHSVKAQLALGSTKDVTISAIDECVMHEDWDPKRTVNDISLLKLVGEILEGPTVSYVKLPDVKLEDDIDVTIAAGVSMGWGLTNVTANQSADVLQCLSLNVLPASKCINTFQTKHDPDTCVFSTEANLCFMETLEDLS